ncbi:MAG: nuclear transport factor 2 family protein [Polyangiales bacterium]
MKSLILCAMSARLEHAKGIYLEGIRDGRVREAITAHTGARYTQHSAGVADGVEGFVEFFEPFIERNPKRDIQIVRVFEDGRYVFVHAYQSLNDGEAEWVTTDLFDTDEDGKIIEHWDVISAFEGPLPSGNSQVDGTTEIGDLELTEYNKARVRLFMTEVLQNQDLSYFDDYVAADLVQHGVGLENGRDACRARIEEAQDAGAQCEFVFKLIGQGDFVVSYSKSVMDDEAVAVFNIWRLADGQIVEHWSNAETIGPREAWGNSGKF